jgi:hypothetical protein
VSVAEKVQLELTVGEDAAWQIFWSDDYGDPVPVADPVLADVKDANGQIVMRFSDNVADTDQPNNPYIAVNGPAGFFQLTAPKSWTALLLPGRYLFDLFATVADSAAPFSRQMQQVCSGWLVALPRVTRIELATEAVLSPSPAGSE